MDFTSLIPKAQTVPGAVILAMAVFCLLCVGLLIFQNLRYRRLSRDTDALEQQGRLTRSQNDFLRQEIASITGWDRGAELPKEPANAIREILLAEKQRAKIDGPEQAQLLGLVGNSLREKTRDILEDEDSDGFMRTGHDKLIKAFDHMAAHPETVSNLVRRSEFHFLLQIALRLDCFYPQSPLRAVYNLALAAICEVHQQSGEIIRFSRPLSVVRREDVDLVYEDYNTVLSDHRVVARARAEFEALSQSERRDTHVVVLECIAPGFSLGQSHTKPRVISFDQGWG